MNSLGAFTPTETSRLSAAFWRHEPVLDQKAASLADATLRFHAAVGGDLIKLTPAGTYQATALGLQDRWEGDPLGRRSIALRPGENLSDWSALRDPGLGRQEGVCLAACASVRQRAPAGVPVLASVFSPLTQAMQLAGQHNLNEHARHDPDAVAAVLGMLTERTHRLVEEYKASGADGMYYVSQHHLADMHWDPLLMALGRAGDDCIVHAARGLPLNIMHFHGSPLQPDLPELPPEWLLHCELAAGNPSLTQQGLPGQLRTFAGIAAKTLRQHADPASRQRYIARSLAQLPPTGNWLGAGCVVPLDFPLALLADWVKSARAA